MYVCRHSIYDAPPTHTHIHSPALLPALHPRAPHVEAQGSVRSSPIAARVVELPEIEARLLIYVRTGFGLGK